ncbi:Gustatory receptor 120e [Halyomorpha halys]|nr:Gustatory receptor 120e [Halyomorpha halys]
MVSFRKKKMCLGTLELCWWEQTRVVLEEVFRMPRLTATFPFNTCYDVRAWPPAVLVVIVVTLSLLSVGFTPETELRAKIFNLFVFRTMKGIVATIYNIVSPLWMISNHKCLIKILRSVATVQKELDKASLKWNYKSMHFSFFLLPAVWYTIALGNGGSLYLKNGFFSAFTFATVVLSSCTTMSYMWQYVSLHDVLRSLMMSISQLEDTDSFVNCYYSIVLAYRAIDKLYGLQIMINIVWMMLCILHRLHTIFMNKGLDVITFFSSAWFFFYSGMIIQIIKTCNYSVRQSKMVNEQLYKRMVYEDNNNLIHDKLLAFHLSSCRKLVFTACGFFNLDNSLICSMVACATTYLVIMLQFTLPTNLQANNQSFAHF